MADIKPGDEVRVSGRSVQYSNVTMPEGGYPGKVTKTGRKYATAEYEYTATSFDGQQEQRTATVEFDMQTGWQRGSVGSFGATVKTAEMAERDVRRDAALAILKEAGIEFRPGRLRRLTLEQIEALAEVAKTFGQEG